MEMRESKVMKKLRAGGVVSSVKVNLADAKGAEIAAMNGFDCVWVDLEHVGQNWSVIEANVWSAKAHNTDVLVRVSRGSYSDYIKPLELDASGIMVPHIMGLEDAKKVIQMTRFYPIGRRPIDGGNADGGYTALGIKEYIRQANKERFVIFQIEDPETLDDLEEIAALDGLDMLFFGPGDFSQGIGFPGDLDHAEIVKTRRRVVEVAKKHGKFAGTVGSPADAAELVEMGYQFINMGGDVVGLHRYYQDLMKAFATAVD